MSLNRVLLLGRLTADPFLCSTTPPRCTFSLAVPRYTREDGPSAAGAADFIPIVAFRGTAELCLRLLAKGSRVLLEGRLHLHRWKPQHLPERSRLEIAADRVTLLDHPRPVEDGPRSARCALQVETEVQLHEEARPRACGSPERLCGRP